LYVHKSQYCVVIVYLKKIRFGADYNVEFEEEQQQPHNKLNRKIMIEFPSMLPRTGCSPRSVPSGFAAIIEILFFNADAHSQSRLNVWLFHSAI
jgi:hypothetical protein